MGAVSLSLTKDRFCEEARGGVIPPLYTEIPYLAPHEVYPAFAGPGSLLFESIKGPEKISRFSFLAFAPYASFKVKDSVVELESRGRRAVSTKRRPLDRLKELVKIYRQRPLPELPPFQGGAAGLFCYDFVNYFEKISVSPDMPKDDLGLPEAFFFMFDRLIAFDRFAGKAWIIFCPGTRETGLGYGDISGLDWKEKYAEAEGAVNGIAAKLKSFPPRANPPGPARGIPSINIEHGITRERYMEMVARAKEYIAAGDIFQANLSLRVHSPTGDADPWTIYSVLRNVNPAPFASFADFGGFQIASSSPERLIKLHNGVVETRPIAGTRPRGADSAGDEAMRRELLLNDKERAEHIMLIDLERNDLGKVSDYGSVRVDELMTTEDYSHVIHIVSNVCGRLVKGRDMFDCLRAAFPGGTITGVPKVRCMQIINELEPARRGPYTGGVGYMGFSGSMDFNILIRTFLLKDGMAYVQAGAGIVADSVPEREYIESMRKAEALIQTLDMVKKGCVHI
ncbi:MAG: anthranilate synthase component I family protein [Nitrospiraceae bacterium]|nr:anthranilate synthase component I family protein [Nitrospiraceae bacterium]